MAKQTYPANKNGIPFGSFIETTGFPGRVIGASNAQRTFSEVYGYGHDLGDVYTSGCTVISKERFLALCEQYGQDPIAQRTDKLKAWDDEQGTWAS